MMKCYYEVLDVSRDADDAEIKSAYKKLALRWHPDKNLEDSKTATEQFQLVQQAYDVLSDRQERTWYDKHREQILYNSSKDFEDTCLNVFQYFTTSCYSGYEDDEGSFYSVYRRVFEAIAREDIEHMDNKAQFTAIPMFGDMDSDYESVVRPFYNFWMSYSTKRSYAWLDPYQLINQRKLSKVIEKENKKVRMKAKKERNEEVRNLVAFVRKRDKRVIANVRLLEQKAKENQKKAEEMARLARRTLRDETKQAVQGEWSKFHHLADELEIIEQQLAEEFNDGQRDESDEDDLYCVACNKIFKTAKAFANHESSKKHRENIERLRNTMLEDEDIKDAADGEDIQKTEGELQAQEEALERLGLPKKKSKQKKSKTLQVECAETQFEDDDLRLAHLEEISAHEELTGAVSEAISKKTKRRKNKANSNKDNDKGTNNANVETAPDINHSCLTCKSVFPSKNKLFAHLKATKHGVHREKGVKNASDKKGKRSKRDVPKRVENNENN